MYSVGGDGRWEPRQSWYDYFWNGILGFGYVFIGLGTLLIIPFLWLWAIVCRWEGSVFREVCSGVWMSLVYIGIGLLGVVTCPFLMICSAWDEWRRGGNEKRRVV